MSPILAGMGAKILVNDKRRARVAEEPAAASPCHR
jgi:hypothetical protein